MVDSDAAPAVEVQPGAAAVDAAGRRMWEPRASVAVRSVDSSSRTSGVSPAEAWSVLRAAQGW